MIYIKIAEAIKSSPYFIVARGYRDVDIKELTEIIKIIANSKLVDIKKDLVHLYSHHPSTIELDKSYVKSSCEMFNANKCTCYLPNHKECWYVECMSQNAQRDRCTKEYADWRIGVFERDNYACQKCGKLGGTLNAHHIKKYSEFPELRYVLDNGITLCESCHRNIHKKEDEHK